MSRLIDYFFTDINELTVKVSKEANLLPAVQEIYKRDIGSPIDGVKHIANKELSYVFFMVREDLYSNLSKKDKDLHLRNRLKLPDKWNPDNVVLTLIKELKEDNVSIQEKLLAAARQNLQDYMLLFEEAGDYNRVVLSSLGENKEKVLNGSATPEELKEVQETLKAVKIYFKEVTGVVKDMKDAFLLLDTLDIDVKNFYKRKDNERNAERSELETNPELYVRKRPVILD